MKLNKQPTDENKNNNSHDNINSSNIRKESLNQFNKTIKTLKQIHYEPIQ